MFKKMTKLPAGLSGREIKAKFAVLRQMQEEIKEAIRTLDVAIDHLPRSQQRRSLRAVQDELKLESGLFPDHRPSRVPRDNWSPERLIAKAIELKETARIWKAASRLKKAQECIKEARVLEQQTVDRQRSVP